MDNLNQKKLFTAAYNGNIKAVRKLLKDGVEVNSVDENGATALMWASLNNHTNIAELLFENNANADIQDNSGKTALMTATVKGNFALVEILLAKTSKINAIDTDGYTALMYAFEDGHLEIAIYLRDNGGIINSNVKGMTLLMFAAINGQTEYINFLLDNSEAIDAKNDEGQSALIYAVINDDNDIVNILLERGAAFDTQDVFGQTPLTYAIKVGNDTIVQQLANLIVNKICGEEYPEFLRAVVTNNRNSALNQLTLDAGPQLPLNDMMVQVFNALTTYNPNAITVELINNLAPELAFRKLISSISEDEIEEWRQCDKSRFFCPISFDLMFRPVYLIDSKGGHRYYFERYEIENWYSAYKTNPLTRENLAELNLFEDTELNVEIMDSVTQALGRNLRSNHKVSAPRP